MSLGVLTTVFTKIHSIAANIIDPSGAGSSFGMVWVWLWTWVWQGICTAIYEVVKWLLAFVDFMQYFVQKLIGLDYWLNRTRYTLEGAIESDLIFGFLYNDTVQKVFRAMVAIFFVLLIIITIYAIIKSEWEHIAGKGGKFGDGVGNSKTKIFKNSIKAIVLVLIFPTILMVGVISSNAILASLIKALNIDTSSTLGGQLFQIGSQTANKYEIYAHGEEGRNAVSDQVVFYIHDGKYLSLSSTDTNTDLVENVKTYEQYLALASESTRYVVNSVFTKLDCGYDISIGEGGVRNFYGYIAKLSDEPFFIMCMVDPNASDGETNSKKAMYHYLHNVLQVPIVTPNKTQGFAETKEIKDATQFENDGYISNLDLSKFYNNEKGYDVVSACYNTWNYASIYAKSFSFENSENYTVVRSGTGVSVDYYDSNDNDEWNSGERLVVGGTVDVDDKWKRYQKLNVSNNELEDLSLLSALNLGQVTSAKVIYNSDYVSPYFDGGQVGGVVQLQSEYLVMAEVINYINQNNFRLHVLDITSDLIDWSGEGDFKVEPRWVSMEGNDLKYIEVANGASPSGTTNTKETVPFVISYSDQCNDTEMGNVLYMGDKVSQGNELNGAKYIMCIKVEGKENSRYIPLVHNKTYTDPTTGVMYTFRSDYYNANYHGVVLAKGLLDSVSLTNAERGEPTYFTSGSDEMYGKGDPYYFDMDVVGAFNQYGQNNGIQNVQEYKVQSMTVGLEAESYNYDVRVKTQPKEGGAEDETEPTANLEFEVYKCQNGDDIAEDEREQLVTPSTDIIQTLRITLVNDSENQVTATYAGQTSSNNYLYTYTDADGKSWYFILNVNQANSLLSVYSCKVTGEGNALTYTWEIGERDAKICAITKTYKIVYDYTTESPDDTDDKQKVLVEEATPNYFDYVKTVKNPDVENSETKAVYTTVDMFTLDNHNLTCYFNISFNTTSNKLVVLSTVDGKPVISFADAHSTTAGDSNENVDARGQDYYVQRSQTVRFNLYDFYTAEIDANKSDSTLGDLKKFDTNSGISDASVPSDEKMYFYAKLDSNDFEFHYKDSYLHLYDGKKYVATIYKVASENPNDSINDISKLATSTTYVLIDGNTYYNIRTQNSYRYEQVPESKPADYDDSQVMAVYYDNVQSSIVVKCVRAARGYTFLEADVACVSVIPWHWRWKWSICITTISDREESNYQFYLKDGIQFDYFFEGNNKLHTFYVPSEISYWIIVIASILMIKVLGTAIWGVIKRIYEITLYFLAAPAVASTVPLDDGTRFNTSIIQPLINKVLSTYGTMLGINVFFILLYPVKSLSQIFTAEDIATSNSYFLKNFMKGIGNYAWRANLLNLYVYILFVLVAFTMISAIPETIAKMVGDGSDISKEGAQVKEKAIGKDGVLKQGLDFASGKSALDAGKKAVDWVKETPGGKLVGGVVNRIKNYRDSVGSDEGGGETDEKKPPVENKKTDPMEAEIMQDIDNKIAEKGGIKGSDGTVYNSYEEAMASGDEEAIKQAQAARSEVENEIVNGDNQEKKDALQRMKEREAGGDETTTEDEKKPEDSAEETAKETFTENMENVAGEMGGDASKMKGNIVRNLAGMGNAAAGKVAALILGKKGGKDGVQGAIFGDDDAGKERKKQAILSTMSEAERQRYEQADEKGKEAILSQYDATASVGEDGQVHMAVKRVKDAAGNAIAEADQKEVAVGAETANQMIGAMAKDFTDDEVQEAIDSNPDQKAELEKGLAKAATENFAAAMSFGADAENDSVANQVIDDIMANPEDSKNSKVIEQGIYEYLTASGNEKVLAAFQKISGLTKEQMQDPAQVKEAIAKLNKNGSIDQLGIKPETYRGFMATALQKSVQSGEFKVDGWDLFKRSASGRAQEYIDAESAKKLQRSNDEAEYEAQKSREVADGATPEQLLRVLAASGNADPEKVAQMFDKFAGLDKMSPDDQKKILEEINKMDPNLVANLKRSGKAETDLDVIKAYQAAMLLDGNANAGNITALLEQSKNNPQAFANDILNGMLANQAKGDMAGVLGMMGGENSIFTEDEINVIKDQYAASGYMGLNDDEKQKLEDMGISAEDAQNMSAFEIQGLLAGKSRDDIFKQIREENKTERLVKEAGKNADVSTEDLIEAAGQNEEAKKEIVDAASQRTRVTTKEDEEKAREEAEGKVLTDQLIDMKRAELEAQGITGDALNAELEKYKNSIANKDTVALYEEFATKFKGDEATTEINDEVNAQTVAYLKDNYSKSKQFKNYKAQWLSENEGKTEEDFYNALAGGDAKMLKEIGFDGNMAELKAGFKKKALQSIAIEGIDGFNDSVGEKKDEILESINIERIAQGYGDYAFAVSDALSKDPKVMKDAEALYRQMHPSDEEGHVDFDDLDEFSKASFMLENFGNRLPKEELDRLRKQHIDEDATQGKSAEEIRQAAFERIAENPEKFRAVYDFMGTVDASEGANKVASDLKDGVIRDQIQRYKAQGIDISIVKDPNTMSADERKKYEHRQSILQAELRGNPEIIANLFKNHTTIGQDKIVADIAATMKGADGKAIDINTPEGKRALLANNKEFMAANGIKNADEITDDMLNNATMNDLKGGLDNNKIVEYMSTHEDKKNELVALGAQNIMTALDKDSQDMKKVDAVLSSPYLRNQATEVVLKEKLGEGFKEEDVKALIKQMLRAEGRLTGFDDKDDAYIEQHLSELKTELALHDISGNTVGERNTDGFLNAVRGMSEKGNENYNEMFATNLNREVTKIIDPANYDPETSSQQFFEVRSVSEFKARDDSEVYNMADAINKFNTKGFKFFNKKSRLVRSKDMKYVPTDAEAIQDLVTDKDIKTTLGDDYNNIQVDERDLVAAAKNDAKIKARLGDDINNYNKVRDFLLANKKESERMQDKARMTKARQDAGIMKEVSDKKFREKIKDKDILKYANSKENAHKYDVSSDEMKKRAAEMTGYEVGSEALDEWLKDEENVKLAVESVQLEKVRADGDAMKVLTDQTRTSAIEKYRKKDKFTRYRKAEAKKESKMEAKGLKLKKKDGKRTAAMERMQDKVVHVNTKHGNHAEANVGNVMMFNELENDAQMRAQVESALQAEGKEYNYDNVMRYLTQAGGVDIKDKLARRVRAQKAKTVLKDDKNYQAIIANATNDEDRERLTEQYLTDHWTARRAVRKSLASTDKKEVREETQKNRRFIEEVKKSKVSDEDVLEYLETDEGKKVSKHIKVDKSEVVSAARSDAYIMGKLGKNATNADIEAYLANNSDAEQRLKNKVKVKKAKADAAVMTGYHSLNFGDNEIKAQIIAQKKTYDISNDDLIKAAMSQDEVWAAMNKMVSQNKGRYAKFNNASEVLNNPELRDKFLNDFFGANQGTKENLTTIAQIAKARQDKSLIDSMVDATVSEDDVSKYMSKRAKANTARRYRKAEKPLEDTFLYKMGATQRGLKTAGVATISGIGKFVGLTRDANTGKLKYGVTQALATRGIVAAAKGVVKGGAATGKGIGHVFAIGAKAVAFKTVKKLPKMCSQYENWNRVLNHKITQVKNDTSLTRAEKEKQIKIFESQKIYLTKPASYANMSAEEQNAFDLEQDKLKRAAYTDKNLVKYVKTINRVKKHGNQADVGLDGALTYDSKSGKNRKERHLQDYNNMQNQARRFRSTAAMRDAERDFGDEFERFARSFLSKKRYFDMIKRYKLKTAIDYQKMTTKQKEAERHAREAALAAQIARLNRVLGKKVAKDRKVDKKSFLAQNGYTDDLLRYKNGYSKFTENHVPKTKLGRKEAKAQRRADEAIQIQNYAASVDKMMNEFVKFSSTYRGSSANFANELKKYAAGLGKQNEEMINKIYKKYANMFRGGLGKLENSPVAVQQKKIMESFAAELKKCQQRVTSKGKIPSTAEMNNMFVGKTFTGATTRAEVALHRQNAEELSRLVKLIKDQKNLVSYESLARRVSSTFMADFMRDNPKINSKSEQAKKAMLESYFTQRLNEALKKAHNDSYQKSDKSQLERLNGRRVKKSEIDHTKVSPVLANAMKTADNPVYQNIVREFKSATEKVKQEQFAHDELVAALSKLKQMPRTPKNIGKTIELQKAVEQSKVKLRTLNNILNNAKNRKADYERSFASTEIKEAKASSRARAYNSSTSVMDRYTFPKKDGTVIAAGTPDAKQVQMLVSNYVQQYRQSIESMLKNEIIARNNNLKKYIDGMRSKFTADFGRNLRYTRQVKEELQKYINEIDRQGQLGDKRLKEELLNSIGRIDKAENELERRMTGMNIDISNVKLKK